jgi:hypothetical protein
MTGGASSAVPPASACAAHLREGDLDVLATAPGRRRNRIRRPSGGIQAIAGVNSKIEGFFALCREYGLIVDEGMAVLCAGPADEIDERVWPRPAQTARAGNRSSH